MEEREGFERAQQLHSKSIDSDQNLKIPSKIHAMRQARLDVPRPQEIRRAGSIFASLMRQAPSYSLKKGLNLKIPKIVPSYI